MTECHKAKGASPHDQTRTDIFANRDLGHEPKVRELHGKVTKVEDAAEPAVLLRLEVGVILDPKDGSVTEGVLNFKSVHSISRLMAINTLSKNASVMLKTASGMTTKSVFKRRRLA